MSFETWEHSLSAREVELFVFSCMRRHNVTGEWFAGCSNMTRDLLEVLTFLVKFNVIKPDATIELEEDMGDGLYGQWKEKLF